jgi:transcriptional regulator with XRE-family HTH domain
MPTPLHLKPPIAAWIVRERRRLGLKPADIAARLTAMGLPVTDATVKVWESNANRRPSPDNLDGLARIFGSQPPDLTSPPSDLAAAISSLTDELRAWREEDRVRIAALERAVEGLLGARPTEREDAASRGRPALPETTG